MWVNDMKKRMGYFSLVFSIIALAISTLTFLKTGGVSDIRDQVGLVRNELKAVRMQSELRMKNRSVLFKALFCLTDAVDSLKAGNTDGSKQLIAQSVEKLKMVEKQLTGEKKTQLEKIREGFEEFNHTLNSKDLNSIRELEHHIRVFRIFEENL